jgi:hypothetical protein
MPTLTEASAKKRFEELVEAGGLTLQRDPITQVTRPLVIDFEPCTHEQLELAVVNGRPTVRCTRFPQGCNLQWQLYSE